MSTSPSPPDSGSYAIAGREEAAAARLQLLAAARYKLAIYLPALSPDMLGSPLELAELRRIATSGRGAEIRLILGNPNAALRMGHRLIDLAQRLSTAIQIRMPSDEETSEATASSAWLLNDTDGYLFLPDAERLEGRAALRDGPGQAPLLLQFERIWERAAPATQLQPLGL
ncbi:hypothetical protein [Dyella caseinilytica]|uniref:DUF7931 domain-containing protein n=1 Tax=Dyella caseinilytica TaxID=1849581 RepID=A0ABX7GXB4_9GAMM|nr:hypothetical protein [Dyella caseinilytica]QRN55101.1 hypothetical protein ISN74_07110 [Dyella caseinilytica]GFZ99395.1 hypothetical protein GCM10011408_20080 [Dyella caseinilytica]